MTEVLASRTISEKKILLWSRQVRQENRGPEANSGRVTKDQ